MTALHELLAKGGEWGHSRQKEKRWQVSPSQVKLYLECPRAWGYNYIEGLKSPGGAGAILGTAMHDAAERYFKGDLSALDDKSDRAQKLGRRLLKYLPDPSPNVAPEAKMSFQWDGILYRGIIDLSWVEDGTLWQDAGGLRIISDHKSSSNPRLHGLRDEQLLTDPQGLAYGLWGAGFHWLEKLGLQWTYTNTRKIETYAVRSLATTEQLVEGFERIVSPIGKAIVHNIATRDEAASLEAKPSACGNFGGCPHAAYCPRTTSEKLTAIFGKTEDMGLADLIKKKKKAPPRVGETQGRTDRINSPEAPANVEVARAISRSGNPKRAAEVSEGAETAEDVAEAMESRGPNLAEGVPHGWEPSATPSQDQVLAWVCSRTFLSFTSQKKEANKDRPYVNGRTLGAMSKGGLIVFEKDGSAYAVSPGEKGLERYKDLNDTDVWVSSPRTITKGRTASSTPNPQELRRDSDSPKPSRKRILAIYRCVDGTISIDIDPGT